MDEHHTCRRIREMVQIRHRFTPDSLRDVFPNDLAKSCER
ncbi:hypothetical protein GJR88_01914 [Dietzia sp. DQ12-45-1b]|nr:hypothetical protein GJR88_01914 [Dietzia sp. DQ12-45-1b]